MDLQLMVETHLNQLDRDTTALGYTVPQRSGSFFRRLFGTFRPGYDLSADDGDSVCTPAMAEVAK